MAPLIGNTLLVVLGVSRASRKECPPLLPISLVHYQLFDTVKIVLAFSLLSLTSVVKKPMPKIELMSEEGKKTAPRSWITLRDLLSSLESRDNDASSTELLTWTYLVC